MNFLRRLLLRLELLPHPEPCNRHEREELARRADRAAEAYYRLRAWADAQRPRGEEGA